MRKVYKVTGQSTSKPSNLPEGFLIKEELVPVDVTVLSKYGVQFRVQSYSGDPEDAMTLEIIPSPAGTSGWAAYNKIFDKENATKLRDALNEILNDKKGRRVIHDATDSLSDPARWYECDNGKFYYTSSRQIPSSAIGGTATYDYIKETYGIRTETTI